MTGRSAEGGLVERLAREAAERLFGHDTASSNRNVHFEARVTAIIADTSRAALTEATDVALAEARDCGCAHRIAAAIEALAEGRAADGAGEAR